jgi:single-stranded-DNA-specific exonuclease
MVREAHPDAAELGRRLKVSGLVAQVLLNRGISDPQRAADFLQPSLHHLHAPEKIAGLTLAAGRIAAAIASGEPIVIYGDYDVDGITATAILWHAIRLLGGRVSYYIPHRIDEGYGLGAEAIEQLAADGAKLIVSVDCGITAIEPANVAARCGVELIITDHHEWKRKPAGSDGHDEAGIPELPVCAAIVHPRLAGVDGTAYPNPNLCGAGVAFKLAWGIGQAVGGGARVGAEFRAFLVEATGLAALGTIADVVPLVGENRVLAYFGLGGLKKSQLTGIQALIESASLGGRAIDSYDVGFTLGPRLNACGRMGHARLAVELLTEAAGPRAMEIATFLESQNRERQALEKQILASALEMVASRGLCEPDNRAVVLHSRQWHAGVIGIVASRIVEATGRPTILIAMNDEIGQGSGRSIPGFHLAAALDACSGYLVSHGGHEMAAGLKVLPGRVDEFAAALRDYARQRIDLEMMVPTLGLDATATLGQMNEGVVRELDRLEPFGVGNRAPMFCVPGVTVAGPPRVVGKDGRHLQLTVKQGTSMMKCIAFGHAEATTWLKSGSRIDLAGEPMVSDFNGRRSVEFKVKDLCAAQDEGDPPPIRARAERMPVGK